MKRASLFLLATLLLAGCGGGGGGERLSKEEYASKADAVCGKYNEQVKGLENPANVSELATTADKTLGILEDALRDLRKLRPPADEQATADQWLAQVETLKGDLEKIRDRARANDLPGVQALVPVAEEHNNRSNELATQLGMRVCNMD